MSKLLVHNGVFVKEELFKISPYNRAFNYADGLFESIRVVNGKLFGFDWHFARLEEAAKILQLESNFFTLKEELRVKSMLLAEKLFMHRGGRIKIHISRKEGGHYLPNNNGIEYLITGTALPDNFFALNSNGLNIDVYDGFQKPIHTFSRYKFLAKELSVLARVDAHKRGFDDAFIRNTNGEIIETSAANVFLVYDDNILVTPGLDSGCLAGTMRLHVINVCLKLGLKVYEQTLTDELLEAGKEIFLTNAIQGVQFVGSYKKKRYFKQVSEVITNALNAKVRTEVQSTELF